MGPESEPADRASRGKTEEGESAGRASRGRLPQNMWELFGLIAKLIGDGTPYLVVAAGVIYAIYAFIDQANQRQVAIDRTRAEADARYRAEIEQAQARINNSYEQVVTLTEKQVSSVQKLLEIQEQAGTALDKQRIATEEARDRAQDEISRAEAARGDLERFRQDLADLRTTEARLVSELDKKAQELSERTRRLNAIDGSLGEASNQIESLKEKYVELARAILESGVAGRPRSLADAAMEEYFPEENPSALWLAAFAQTPGRDALETLKKLRGSRSSALSEVVSQDLGYELWIDVEYELVGDNRRHMFFGCQEVTGRGYRNCLMLEFSGPQDGESTLQSIDGYKDIIVVQIPSSLNWNALQQHVLFEAYSEREEGPYLSDFPLFRRSESRETWSFAETVGGASGVVTALNGTVVDQRILDVDGVEGAFPSLYGHLEFGFAESLAMIERAKNYESRMPSLGEGDRMPETLRKVFSDLLRFCVQRNDKEVRRIVSGAIPPRVFGEIAAIALKRDFRVAAVGTEIRSSGAAQIAIQQRQVTQELPGDRERSLVYNIDTTYEIEPSGEPTDQPPIIRFAFEETLLKDGWILIRFEPAPLSVRGS